MLAIEFDDLSAAAYRNFRFGVMGTLWGTAEKATLDWNEVPLIGTGFNLRLGFDFDVVANEIFGVVIERSLRALLRAEIDKTYAEGQDNLLRQNLHQVLVQWNNTHVTDVKAFFEFDTAAQMKNVLDILGNGPESTLTWADINMPSSEERAAVFGLAYEGVDIDNILQAILTDSDRAQAWYEIRYNSNDATGPIDRRETATRRYIQSDYFELYNDPAHVDLEEARHVAMVYGAHRLEILDYEDRYQPGAGGANGAAQAAGIGNTTIAGALQGAISGILDHYGITAGGLEEVLYVRGASDNMNGDGTAFDNAKNDGDLIVGNDRANTLDGQQGNDVLIGLGAKDRLFGGTGNDKLYGGEGNDVLRGEAGNDQLTGGAGGDTLIGAAGNDTYRVNGDDTLTEVKGDGTDTLLLAAAGSYNVRHIERFRLADDIAGSAGLMLNEFDRFDLSDGNDILSLTINRLQKDAIDIVTHGGADTIRIKIAPGIDPSQVLDQVGLTARFDFADLSANDTIDLTSINIKKIVATDFDITQDQGYYLMAPGAQIHLMINGNEEKTYNNNTESWFVVKCGDDTPYGPEFIGNIDTANFDI